MNQDRNPGSIQEADIEDGGRRAESAKTKNTEEESRCEPRRGSGGLHRHGIDTEEEEEEEEQLLELEEPEIESMTSSCPYTISCYRTQGREPRGGAVGGHIRIRLKSILNTFIDSCDPLGIAPWATAAIKRVLLAAS